MTIGHANQTALVTFSTLVAPAAFAAFDTISGRAEVINGDTIAVESVEPRKRLYGMDAPEDKQT